MSDGIKRRDFIKISAFSTLVLGSGLLGSLKSYARKSELVVVKGELIKATRKAIELLGGIKRFVKPGMKVIIKPNMSFAFGRDRGANTDPEMVAEVARMCVEAGAKEVLVCDHPLYPAPLCLLRSGIRQAMEKVQGARFQYFTDPKFYKEVSVPKGVELKKVRVLKPVLDADLIINLPRAKTHADTTVTLGLKNLMGLIWDRKKFHARYNLHQAIADLASLIRPQLTIIDASTAMTAGGPGGPGPLARLNLVVAGTNPLEVDALMVSLSKWYGRKYSPSEIKHLALASKMGLGEIESSKLKPLRVEV